MPIPIYDKLVSAFGGPIIDSDMVDDINLTNAVYVNSNGDDGNDGRSLTSAVATFTRALTIVNALVDTKAIICLDAGIYSENITVITDDLIIYAPHCNVGSINTTGRNAIITVFGSSGIIAGINSVINVNTLNGSLSFEGGTHNRTEVTIDNIISPGAVVLDGTTGNMFLRVNQLADADVTVPASLNLRGHIATNIYGNASNVTNITGANVSVDTTNFNGNLSPTDNNIQLVAQAVDDLATGGGNLDFIRVRPNVNNPIDPTLATGIEFPTLEVNTNTSKYSIQSNQVRVASAGTYLILLNHTIITALSLRADPILQLLINGVADPHRNLGHYAENFGGGGTSAHHSTAVLAVILQLNAADLIAAQVSPGDSTLVTDGTLTVAADTFLQVIEMRGIAGPRGAQGPQGLPGLDAPFASTARYDTLFTGVSGDGSAGAVNVTLTFPSDITDIGEYAFLEVGTSRTTDGVISYNIVAAATVDTATSASPFLFFPTSSDGTTPLGSGYSIYLSNTTTLVYVAGANRAYLRSFRGISLGIEATPQGWIIQNMVITPDPTATPVLELPSTGVLQFYAYRIAANGFIRGQAVVEGDWLLALVNTPSATSLDDWDVIAGNRFPVSSGLFQFSEQLSENDNIVLGVQVSTATIFLLASIPTTPPTGGQSPQYTDTSDNLNAILVVSFPTDTVTSTYRFRQRDGGHDTILKVFDDDFVKLSITDPSNDYYLYGIAQDTATNFRYLANTVLEIVETVTERHFTLDGNTVDLTPNISNLQISQLDAETRALIQSDHSLSAEEQAAIDGLQTTSTSAAIGDTFQYYYRMGVPSGVLTDYTQIQNDDGIIPAPINETVTVLVDKTATITSVDNGTNLQFVGILVDRKAYTFTLTGSDDPLNNTGYLNGTVATITLTGAVDSFKIDRENLDATLDNEIYVKSRYTLPEPLRVLSGGATVTYTDGSNYLPRNIYFPNVTSFAFLKSTPTPGTSTPIQQSDFTNQINNSDVTAVVDTAALPNVFVSNTDGSGGLLTPTNNRLSGQGIQNGYFTVTLPDINNPNLLLGGWIFQPSENVNNNIFLAIKERGSANFRTILSYNTDNFYYHIGNDDATIGDQFIVTNYLHNIFEGTQDPTGGDTQADINGPDGRDNADFHLDRTETYIVQLTLFENDIEFGSSQYSYVISDLNTTIPFANQNITFSSGSDTRVIPIGTSYRRYYQGQYPYVILVRSDALIAIQRIRVRVYYATTANVNTGVTFNTEGVAGWSRRVGSPHRILAQFYVNQATSKLFMNIDVDGVSAETVNLNYPWTDLDYTQIRLGGGLTTDIGLNFQGGKFFKTTLPAFIPSPTVVRDYNIHFNNQFEDIIYGLFEAPNKNVETVELVETTLFRSLILRDDNGNNYRLGVDDTGALTTTQL